MGWLGDVKQRSYIILGLWESLNNENFKGGEFDMFKNEGGSDSVKE